MYEPLLFIHSWVRWIVLLSILYFFCRSSWSAFTNRPFTASDSHFLWAFNQIFLYQALFGFTLWLAASPIVHAGFLNPSRIATEPLLFFWTVRHPVTMLVAVAVFHVGRSRANRAATSKRHKIYAVTFAGLLILIFSAIPWPGLEVGRTLIRGFQ